MKHNVGMYLVYFIVFKEDEANIFTKELSKVINAVWLEFVFKFSTTKQFANFKR